MLKNCVATIENVSNTKSLGNSDFIGTSDFRRNKIMSSVQNEKTMFAMRIDKSEKDELRQLYSDMGLDLSTAVNLFFKQSLLENGLPFKPSRDKVQSGLPK